MCLCMLKCVAMCCSVLQCIGVCCSLALMRMMRCVSVYVEVCCNVLQCVAVCCSLALMRLLSCVAVCCSVLQCVAVCCSVLHYVVVPVSMRSRSLHANSTLTCRDSTQINLNKTNSGNPRSTSNQSSKPCTVIQYPSRKARQLHAYL